MQIPFEVDPPKKDKISSKASQPAKPADPTIQASKQQQKPLTVTQLTRQISLLLEGKFRSLLVEAELSNVKRAASGHWYFSFKDDKSQIRGVMFRQAASSLRFEPEDGLEVVVRGHLTVYQQRGEYQIMVSALEPKGLGALQLAFEQLKAKLDAEGLFLPEHKQPLPFLPSRIGIITSQSGAVIHDMLTVLERRFCGIPVLFFPVQVQGDSAAAQMVEALQHLNSLSESKQIDVIVIGRGGGSIEDLWAFNDEKLARAIFTSAVPVISAVGHETDFTIADFVSDLRAPTPSAAIELAVPKKEDLKQVVSQKEQRLLNSIYLLLERLNEYVAAARQRLSSPNAMIAQFSQRVDDMDSLLKERMTHLLENFQRRSSGVTDKLLLLNPGRDIAAQQNRVELLEDRLKRAIGLLHKERAETVQQQMSLLDSLSPLSVLHRGYSVTLDQKGKSLRSVKDVQSGEELQVRMDDGTLQTKVVSVKRN
ncbi:MAG: exodeoxyribonuclease VII large subunit [SAR324 cluster bacterium]|nr:exodeoxyribonuclease VII large subunit [SAR324 cluster bacterium]MBL7036190.1 exodeoxyribonuclease VII large subunit [SAR324 cluster bacterium]